MSWDPAIENGEAQRKFGTQGGYKDVKLTSGRGVRFQRVIFHEFLPRGSIPREVDENPASDPQIRCCYHQRMSCSREVVNSMWSFDDQTDKRQVKTACEGKN